MRKPLCPICCPNANSLCSTILRDGVWDITTVRSHEDVRHELSVHLSHFSFEDVTQSGGVSIPIIETVIGGKFTKERFDSWKSSLDEGYQRSIDTNVLIRRASPAVLEAYNRCIDTLYGRGLRMELEYDTDGDLVTAIVHWAKAPSQPTQISLPATRGGWRQDRIRHLVSSADRLRRPPLVLRAQTTCGEHPARPGHLGSSVGTRDLGGSEAG